MEQSPQPQQKIGLLTITATLATVTWLIGGIVLFVMLRQQARIEADAQHIYDVSSAKVFEATRTIRALERLAREGDAILWMTNAGQRKLRRDRLQSLLDDAALQGDGDLRRLVARSFATLDQSLAELNAEGVSAQAEAASRWGPVMQDVLNQSDAIGAEVSDLAAQEADRILVSTESARSMLLWVAGFLVAASLALFGFIYFALARPLVRLSNALVQARDGRPIVQDEEFVRELQMLHDAAVALSGAHRKLEIAQVQLEELAHTDALTVLANRRMFEQRGHQAFEHARRYQESLCAILFDIDRFKQINDQFGHEGGDIVLRELGNYLRATLRGSDSPVARIGGEEFGLLLAKASLHEAAQTAERLRHGIGQLSANMPNGETIRFTVSLGVAARAPEDTNLSGLLRRADLALYQAKQGGRNRVELAP